MEEHAPGLAEAIWRRALERGAHGIIADEMTVEFEKHGVTQSTVSARMRALKYSKLLVREPNDAERPTRSNHNAEVWIAAPCDDFHATFRTPPPKNKAAEARLLEAAHEWVESHGKDVEGDALEALHDAAWAAYGEGSRPKPPALGDDWEG